MFYHCANKEASKHSDKFVILFSNDINKNYGYGPVCSMLEDSEEFADADEFAKTIEKALIDDDCMTADDDFLQMVQNGACNPSDIVDSAAAWDDCRFVTWCVDHIDMPKAIRTNDGLVVFSRDLPFVVESTESVMDNQ